MHGWAKPAEAGERFVATLLVTDIVDSTKVAVRLGDAAWKGCSPDTRQCGSSWTGFAASRSRRATGSRLLRRSRTSRAVCCGDSRWRAAGWSSDPRERPFRRSRARRRKSPRRRGHAVTRIAALANPGEVLVSAPTASLLEGAGLRLEDAGEHELKGLASARRIYRLVGLACDWPSNVWSGALRILPHEDHVLHTVINESLADVGSAPPTGAIPLSHESPESMVSNPDDAKESSSLEPRRPQQIQRPRCRRQRCGRDA